MDFNGLIWPDWQHNLVNIAATLADYLGVPTQHALLPDLKKALDRHYRHVVYLVVDGMGSRILGKNLPADSFLRRHLTQELTSVFPSTTVSATTTLQTALTPAEHGWFAWSVDFDGTVIELFKNRNFYTQQPTADPQFAMHQQPVTPFFANPKRECTVHVVMPHNISNKLDIANYHEFTQLKQMYHQIDTLCQADDPQFVYAYFSDLDTMMHMTGTTSRATRRLLRQINRYCAKLVQNHPDTLLVVTADHGQVDTRGFVPIYQDQSLQTCLTHPVSMDPRGACFFVDPAKTAQFQYACQKYQPDFYFAPTDYFVQANLFGGVPQPAFRAHLGDYLAIGTAAAKMLVFAPGHEYGHKKIYRGQHTGMTPDEMLVPLIIAAGDQE